MKSRSVLMIFILVLCAALGIAARDENEMKKRASRSGRIPASSVARPNPYEGRADAAKAGRKLYERYCAECHGKDLAGRGKAPALDSQLMERALPGDLFWFLTNGNLRGGMPSWSRLPEAQRWQIVTYLKSVRNSPAR